jgi:hypothetical protein
MYTSTPVKSSASGNGIGSPSAKNHTPLQNMKRLVSSVGSTSGG